MSSEVILTDTDAALAMAHSDLACSYLRQYDYVTLPKEVWEELKDPRLSDPQTHEEASRMIEVFEESPATPVEQDSVDTHSGEEDYGEQGIKDYIIYGDKKVERVLFFDSDVGEIEKQLCGADASFHPPTKLFDLLNIEQNKAVVESLKLAKGRGWTSDANVYTLLVDSGIISRREYQKVDVGSALKSIQSDL